ncbi:MAG: TPM domain-containing protein [Ruminococcus sp.]|nr:TPM domain-containing protein [Ruminococcus sp.]
MRKILSLFTALLTVFTFALPTFADTASSDVKIADYRGTFTEDQLTSLSAQLSDTLDKYNICGVIMISDAFEDLDFSDAIQYCDDKGLSSYSSCLAMVYSFEANDLYVYIIHDNQNAFDSTTLAYFEYDLYDKYTSFADGVFSNEAIYAAAENFCQVLSDAGEAAASGTPITADYFTALGDNATLFEDDSEESSEAANYDTSDPGLINENELTRTIPENRLVPRLVDGADLLDPPDEERLLKKLDEYSEKHELDIIIVTTQSIGMKTSEQYADDYYDYNGCGYGPGDDGILFLISMENRDWAISTYGKGIPYFTDAGQKYMQDQFLPALRNDDYVTAFGTFADLCDDFCTKAENGSPYDYGNLPRKPFSFMALVSAAVIALIIAFAVCTHYKKQLSSVAFKKGAADYFRPGSFVPGIKEDIFLYKNVSKVRRQSSSGGHGGSSTHHSSSGRSHGGSHGHF